MGAGPFLLLPGDWTSARLLVRILYTIKAEWELTERGLEHQETGEVCGLTMGPADEALIERMAAHDDPVYPSLTVERLDALRAHKTVVRVEVVGGTEPVAACRTLLRCGSALIDAGGHAVWVEGGLAHGPERWQSLAEDVDDDQGVSLFRAFVRPILRVEGAWRTAGLRSLGHREILVDGAVAEPYAYDVLDALGQRLVGGPGLNGGEMLQPGRTGPRLLVTKSVDPLPVEHHEHHPGGVWRVSPA